MNINFLWFSFRGRCLDLFAGCIERCGCFLRRNFAAVIFSCTMPCRIFAAVNFSRTDGPTQVPEKRAKWPEIRLRLRGAGGAVSGNTRMG